MSVENMWEKLRTETIITDWKKELRIHKDIFWLSLITKWL